MNNFCLLRKTNNKTQAEVAKSINIPTNTYRNYETGMAEPNITNLIKLADYYNVTLDYLVGRPYSNDVGYLTDDQREFVKLFLQLKELDQAKVYGIVSGIITTY